MKLFPQRLNPSTIGYRSYAALALLHLYLICQRKRGCAIGYHAETLHLMGYAMNLAETRF